MELIRLGKKSTEFNAISYYPTEILSDTKVRCKAFRDDRDTERKKDLFAKGVCDGKGGIKKYSKGVVTCNKGSRTYRPCGNDAWLVGTYDKFTAKCREK